ncbi:ATP-binding protein, partial [Enterococcus faecium]
LKYTGDEGEISVDVQKNGGFLVFAVADNGEGISDEDKKKIFDRFFRVDKARTRQKGGLGLGLSLAKQIVEAYNGKITVEDNKPKGTKFIV